LFTDTGAHTRGADQSFLVPSLARAASDGLARAAPCEDRGPVIPSGEEAPEPVTKVDGMRQQWRQAAIHLIANVQ
jgi:hypothetical protein